MKVEKIIGQWFEVNCYCLSNDKNQCVLVDTGAKLEEILKLVGNKEVVAILLTHGHFDHAVYLQYYIDYFKVPVYAHKNIAKTLKDNTLNQSEDWEILQDLPIIYLDNEGEFEISDFKIQYFSASGHSPCCICYKINDLLFAGDVLFNSGIGRTDLKGSDKKAMLTSLEKLEKVEFKTLYSGHGEESDFARQKRNIAVFKRFLSR